MKTVKLMIEVEMDSSTEKEVRDAVKDMLSESYYTATAVEIYNPEHAERAAFNVLDHELILSIRANNQPSYSLRTDWDAVHKALVKAMDPIEHARARAEAGKKILGEML